MNGKNNEIDTLAASSKWVVDPAHTKIQFSARHFVISEVTGQFNKFQINFNDTNDDFTSGNLEVLIDVKSIDTDNTDRDNHLKSPDFFDAEKFDMIKFSGKTFEKVDEEEYKLKGDLTIKEVTKPVELEVIYGGKIVDPYGYDRAAFKVKGKINRFDFGLNWNNLMETGGAVVGKNIEITASVEMLKEKKNENSNS